MYNIDGCIYMYRIREDEKYKIYYYGFDESDQMYNFLKNFGSYKVKRLENFNDIFKYSGNSLVLCMFIKDYRNFDIKYRNKLKYSHVFVLDYEVTRSRDDKFSNIVLLNENGYADIDLLIDSKMEEDYEFFVPKKFQHEKLKKLSTMHEILKEKKCFSSIEISREFNISIRNVERYMRDINYLYNDIGYDYVKNEYYVCK